MKLPQFFQSSLSPLAMRERVGKSLLLGGLLLLSSCVQESFVADDESQPVEIKLSGAVAPSSVDTRTAVDDAYVKENDLLASFARSDESTNGTWPSATSALVLDATRAKGTGATAVNFAEKQYYTVRSSNNTTRLMGWYPRVNNALVTYTPATAIVSFDLSKGNVDVMTTQVVRADKTTQFGSTGKEFAFSHHLTQITVKAYGDATAATNFGVIQSIEVVGTSTSCQFTLFANNLTFAGSSDVKLRYPGTDVDMSDNIAIPNGLANAVACGYALFQPTAAKTFQLKVTTSLGGARTFNVSSPQTTFAKGVSYEVVLSFTSTGIAPSAKIGTWADGGDVTGKVEV